MKRSGYCFSIVLLALLITNPALAQLKRHPVGTVTVTTEVRGDLVIDTMAAQSMTVYHQVTVSGMDTGMHTLTFRHDSVTVQKRIFIAPGRADKYVIRPDSIKLKTTVKGRYLTGYKSSVHTSYIPKTKGLYGLGSIGFSSGRGHSSFNGMVVAGYQFSPLFLLGGGTGYLNMYKSYDQKVNLLIVSSEIKNSTVYPVTFIPVFIDVRLNFSRKWVTPYFSVDIGCSFPLSKNINGSYQERTNFLGYAETTVHYFHIDKLNPGVFLALNPGLKIFLFSKYYLDFTMGVDLSFNKVKGTEINSAAAGVQPISETRTFSCFHMNVGFGF